MIKLIFRIIGWVISVACVLFTVYFLFANNGYGIELLKTLFEDGFLDGLKSFFVDIWEGFKHVVGL